MLFCTKAPNAPTVMDRTEIRTMIWRQSSVRVANGSKSKRANTAIAANFGAAAKNDVFKSNHEIEGLRAIIPCSVGQGRNRREA